MESGRELVLEGSHSIREALWRMAEILAQDAAETLDTRIEVEILNGKTETVEVREALVERLQALSLERSERLDAYQKRHAPR
jgi:hypothetical protein